MIPPQSFIQKITSAEMQKEIKISIKKRKRGEKKKKNLFPSFKCEFLVKIFQENMKFSKFAVARSKKNLKLTVPVSKLKSHPFPRFYCTIKIKGEQIDTTESTKTPRNTLSTVQRNGNFVFSRKRISKNQKSSCFSEVDLSANCCKILR